MTPRAKWEIALTATAAACAYLLSMTSPPVGPWAWVLWAAGMVGAVANALRALFSGTVVDGLRIRKG